MMSKLLFGMNTPELPPFWYIFIFFNYFMYYTVIVIFTILITLSSHFLALILHVNILRTCMISGEPFSSMNFLTYLDDEKYVVPKLSGVTPSLYLTP